MSKKTFNPADWTETNKTESKATANNKPVQSTTLSPSPHGEGSGVRSESDIETITQRIESSSVDIAPNYADWRDLGFARVPATDVATNPERATGRIHLAGTQGVDAGAGGAQARGVDPSTGK